MNSELHPEQGQDAQRDEHHGGSPPQFGDGDDSLAIDARLDRIRIRVEQALAFTNPQAD